MSAAARPDGHFVLCGIANDLRICFERPLPARGHAAAAHPNRPEAVAFARRPGTFALVIDCVSGAEKAVLSAPKGRHFYGHGAFSADGHLLFTTENDFEAGRGCIGVWDAQNGYVRIDEWDSGGIGPHDIKRLPGTDILAVANGGIETHPNSGRVKLNIATMAPNLTYVEHGTVIATAALPAAMHKNSIRHLAVDGTGQVAFGMQWQGDGSAEALVGVHQIGQSMRLMFAGKDAVHGMRGYIGSIAISSEGQTILVTSPKGGLLQEYDAQSGKLSKSAAIPDVCGVAVAGHAIAVSSGTGTLQRINRSRQSVVRQTQVQWDNHLVPIAQV